MVGFEMVEDIEKWGYVVFVDEDYEEVVNFYMEVLVLEFVNVIVFSSCVVVYIKFENYIGNGWILVGV